MLPSECRTKQHENGLKRDKIAYNCSVLPCEVICVAAQCRHAYSCNKIARGLSILNFFDLARFLRCQGDWRYLFASILKSTHSVFFGLTWAEKKNIYELAAIRSFFVYAYQLLSSVMTALYIFFFSVSNSLDLLIFLRIRISEATPKEFLRYSKRETRWYMGHTK